MSLVNLISGMATSILDTCQVLMMQMNPYFCSGTWKRYVMEILGNQAAASVVLISMPFRADIVASRKHFTIEILPQLSFHVWDPTCVYTGIVIRSGDLRKLLLHRRWKPSSCLRRTSGGLGSKRVVP